MCDTQSITNEFLGLSKTEEIDISEDNIIKEEIKEEEKEADLLVSYYRISTITSVAQLNELINLKVLYDNIDSYLIPYQNDVNGVFYMEYGSSKNFLQYKGQNIKPKKTKKLQNNINVDNTNEVEYKVKRFDNQATLYINYYNKYINLKVFKNGKIQMTGLNDINSGQAIVDICLNIIKEVYTKKNKEVVDNIENLANTGNSIILINSDFSINITIKRPVLNTILKTKYNNKSFFEPCIYQGVKMQYYWNNNGLNQNGNCACMENGHDHCRGKGTGDGFKQCKKITICIFQSGKIIITGSQNLQQLEDCYNYIVNVIKDNLDEIMQSKLILTNNLVD